MQNFEEKLNLWKEASKSYYDIEDEPIMSDAEFDELTLELKESGVKEIVDIVSGTIQTTEGLTKVDN